MLDLGDNNVGDKGAELLRDSLKGTKCELTVLYLDFNKIGDIGAKHLSDAIKDNCKLTWLHLGRNNIGDQGAEYLSNALKDRNRKLPRLRVRLGSSQQGDALIDLG